jgi:hypothetical protein
MQQNKKRALAPQIGHEENEKTVNHERLTYVGTVIHRQQRDIIPRIYRE